MLRSAATGGADHVFAAIRRREFSRLDASGLAYLDYTGSALYGVSQIDAHRAGLACAVFGNPHSEHTASRRSSAVIAAARDRVLRHFDVDDRTHVVCFTANASAAIKLVAESYPFGPAAGLVLSTDNHNSVNGIRMFAARAGAWTRQIPLGADLRLDRAEAVLDEAAGVGAGLVAYPAQSNFSGVHHPLDLVERAKSKGFDVLLDAAAFVPSHALSLRNVPADFTAISFYKMFGYPTGVGALIATRDALSRLRRPWFAGGTVMYASVQASTHRLLSGPEAFEDGTPDFLGLAALHGGFDLLDEVGLARLSVRVRRLTGELLSALTALRHRNGAAVVTIHGPSTVVDRGGTVAFNVLDDEGRAVPYSDVERRAADAGVSLRGGCFCNPGASEAAFGFDSARTSACFDELAEAFTVQRFADCQGRGQPVGALRASVGLATSPGDLVRAVEVVKTFGRQARDPRPRGRRAQKS